MDYTDILYEKKEGIGKLTINRPDKMNAFTAHTWDEMQKALIDAWHDNEVGVVILTGAGDKAFCTGGDVSARTDDGYGGHFTIPGPGHILRSMPKVTIAMVNGFAADVESITGIQEMAGISLFQYYAGDESKEGSRAFLEKRPPDYSKWR